jgi:M6 family metalloprotease-like protein
MYNFVDCFDISEIVKKIFLLLTAMMLGATSLWARPGYSKPVDVFQPDGTTVTLLMHGDEFLNFTTTIDGYTVVKGEDGYYRYAEKEGDMLKPTNMTAKNPELRNAEERAFLTGTRKFLHPEMSTAQKEFKARAAKLYADNYDRTGSNKNRASIWNRIDYNNFKGLVVLVEFNDRKFTVNDPKAFYQRLTNEKNLTDNSLQHYPVPVTGSVKDYFYDNSMGIFEPTFDVIGPVTVNYSCTYPKPKDINGNVSQDFSNRNINLMKAAMTQVNSTVNFKDYDLNADGIIDMVYFIYAGYGSYVQGNDYRYMWPHAEDMSSYSSYYAMTYDGKRFGRYACSVEIQDYEEYANQHVWLDGIGTMCHEFSHVLGLADHYDTDYEQNGQAREPGAWDLMSGGTDLNYGLTPVGYNSFERHILGFCEPDVIDTPGSYELEPFNSGNKAYRVMAKKVNEEFYIENRQNQGWDLYLPGHGLVVWRADTSKPSVWQWNEVNNSPDAIYFEILGNAPITEWDLTPETNDTWGDKGAAIDLFSITQKDDGNITFETGKDLYPSQVEDFETTPLTEADANDLQGRFCKWSLTNAIVTSPTERYGSGEHVVKFGKNSMLTSSKLDRSLHALSFSIANYSQAVNFGLRTSTDGENWEILPTTTGRVKIQVAKNQKLKLTYGNIPAGTYIQFVVASNKATECYLDDVVFAFSSNETGISTISASAADKEASYNLAGQKVGNSYRGLVISNGRKHIKK